VKAIILSSPEYYQARGGNTDDGFLNALFQDTLGRPIDPPTRALTEPYLAGGGSRFLLALTVLRAPEADKAEAQGFYSAFLDRPAEPQGLDNAVNILQTGLRDETLTALFLATDEYFLHANQQ